jgi:integrase
MARQATGSVIERVGKGGAVYALRFRAGGKRRFQTLDVGTRAAAEIELSNVLADVRRGRWQPPAEPAPVIEQPTWHRLASDWVARRRGEVDERTAEHWLWGLSGHLLAAFGDLRPSEITTAHVQRFVAGKVADRARQQDALERWRGSDPRTRGRMPSPGLSAASVNKLLKLAGSVQDDAIEAGWCEVNVFRGKRQRLRAAKPRRTWLSIDESRALLEAGGEHRALIAAMMLGGLRVSEAAGLRWRDVDLAAARLRVTDAKTDAGERTVDVIPMLLDELKSHRARARFSEPSDYVFATSRGTARRRSNISRQILAPAVARANVRLEAEGRSPIEGATNHSLRRTYCALLYEAGATPAYTMQQMGHTDPGLALAIYTKVMERKRDTGERMDALMRGADWAQTGTNGNGDASPALASVGDLAL